MQGPVARLLRHAGESAVRRPDARRRHRRGARRAVTRDRCAGFRARREPVHRAVRVVEGRAACCATRGHRVEVHERRRRDRRAGRARRAQRRRSAAAGARGRSAPASSGWCSSTRCFRTRAGAGPRPCPRRSRRRLQGGRGRRQARAVAAVVGRRPHARAAPRRRAARRVRARVPGGAGRGDRRGDARGPRARRRVRAARARPTRPRPSAAAARGWPVLVLDAHHLALLDAIPRRSPT